MKTFRSILIGLVIASAARVGVVRPVWAEPIGDIISYQGKLTNADGTPVANGTQSVTFNIYENGSPVFTQNSSVATVGGVFSAFLGVGALNFDPVKQYEMGVTFGGTETKHSIASVPVAQVAKSVTVDAIAGSEWRTYTPIWAMTAGNQPSIGNGVIRGSYQKLGRVVYFEMQVATGSTTTFGSGGGVYEFTLPLPAAQDTVSKFTAYLFEAGTAHYLAIGIPQGQGGPSFRVYQNGNTGAGISPTVPFLWRSGCSLSVSGTYQAAE
ncbi:MAG: hypothetical protein AUJ92_18210 [Armatimonadetes bacterium CG2_30_59_28]|nr:MAG: hypothetical protein AUJ92_18210 [Armatimonadetes bacterium CG2_30_59_28]PIU62873.1 MAG: hypothetical protein COS85_17340 [Armatimonadetes bacterium CG07_land_8_20_14_0_80_59_28]PJB70792.1 MAG: hypothetical protein CO095_08670 [Armatimonadetes bacterium CG_4_9_14_3_um_filter_58_7]